MQLHTRRAGIGGLVRTLTAQTVVWAVHGGVIEILLCHVLGVDLHRRWEFHYENAAISEFEIRHPGASVVRPTAR